MKRARSQKAKELRKQLLLDAALDVFFEKGFNAARMDDIAERANLSKGTVYLYFDSKDALFNGLIANVAFPKLEEIQQLAASSASFKEALSAISEFAPRVILESKLPRLIKIMIGEAQTFPEIIKSYREQVIDRVLSAIELILRQAKASGEISVDEPALMARLIVAPILFSSIWSTVFKQPNDVEVDLVRLFQLHTQIIGEALTIR